MTTDAPSERGAAPTSERAKPAAEVGAAGVPAVAASAHEAKAQTEPRVVPAYDPFAAAAAEAFGTVEVPAPQPRVLEESFDVPVAAGAPVVTTQPEPSPVPTEVLSPPAWQQSVQASGEEEAFVAPAWQQPAIESQAEPQPEPQRESQSESLTEAYPQPEARFYVHHDVQPDVPSEVMPEVAPEVVPEMASTVELRAEALSAPEPAAVAPAWDQPSEMPQAVTPASQMADVVALAEDTAHDLPQLAPDLPQAVGIASQPDGQQGGGSADVASEAVAEASAETVSGPTNFSFEPSRPDSSRIKRRVREKRARDFSAMGATEDAATARPQPVTDAFAPSVPVDTRPLDQVDDALIASGVMAPRPGDSLTRSLPGGVAESAGRFEVDAASQPEPQPMLQSELQPEPQPEPQLESQLEPRPEPQPEPVSQLAPAPAEEASSRLEPVLPAASPSVSQSAPQSVDVALPSFTLSNTSATAQEAPLPAPQSDLPWVQPQAAAEWDIGAPAGQEWAQNMPETAAEPAPHMPPQADLYKPMAGRPASLPPHIPSIPGGIPSPSSSTTLTPELPGQRRKANGTPWALVAVGAVVVLAAGGYLLTSGKQGSTAQLANLTNRTATGNEQHPLLPPPDSSSRGSGSFMAAQPASAGDSDSSAMVAFADVPPEVANQPIVADGTEDMPKGFVAQFQNEVEKARGLKDGVAPETAALGGQDAAAAPVAPGYTQDDLKKELEAYRSALASSANPAALKPGSVNVAQTNARSSDADFASGSLLPPPAALPPAELYTNNPNNLPVVAEPVTNAPEKVRTLADFPDVSAYMPEREKVEIPANVKPKLAATDFPALEVLSYVPNQGVVAFADGREGVLLIGESINGWELVAVHADSAEFKAGQKSYQVTSQN